MKLIVAPEYLAQVTTDLRRSFDNGTCYVSEINISYDNEHCLYVLFPTVECVVKKDLSIATPDFGE